MKTPIRRWIGWVVAGESIGFAVAAVVGVWAGAWITATVLAAGAAWAIGMTPSVVGLDLASPGGIVLVGIGGAILLLSIPTAQWAVVRTREAARWIPVNAGAWAAAILWTFAPSPFIDESSPVELVVALYVVAGLLMALTVAVLTARTASRLFAVERASVDSTAATS